MSVCVYFYLPHKTKSDLSSRTVLLETLTGDDFGFQVIENVHRSDGEGQGGNLPETLLVWTSTFPSSSFFKSLLPPALKGPFPNMIFCFVLSAAGSLQTRRIRQASWPIETSVELPPGTKTQQKRNPAGAGCAAKLRTIALRTRAVTSSVEIHSETTINGKENVKPRPPVVNWWTITLPLLTARRTLKEVRHLVTDDLAVCDREYIVHS